MKLFSEQVTPTSTNSSLNILQVENYDEIFFNVYEIEINKTKYLAEKVSDYNGSPVISVPVDVEGGQIFYPFVLSKGKQEVIFNEANADNYLEISLVDKTPEEDEIPLVEHVPYVEEQVPVKINSKKLILEQIENAKEKAKQEIRKAKLQKKKELQQEGIQNENRLKTTLDESKQNLLEEFVKISNRIKDELVDVNDSRFSEIEETIDNKIEFLVGSFKESLDKDFVDSVVEFDSKLQDMAQGIYESIHPKIDKELTDIATQIVEKVASIEETLTDKLKDKADISIIEKVENSISAVQKSNIELHDTINKGVNKALSRVGNVNNKVDELTIALSEEVDARIQEVESNITVYYEGKLKMLEDKAFDITEETRKYIVDLVQESKTDLIQEIRQIKNEKPIEYIIESKGKKETKDFDAIRKDFDRQISSKIDNEVTRLRRYIAVYSGGGSVAMQFADGGTMNGNLIVNGTISSNGLSAGNITSNSIFVQSISANNIYALSSTFRVIDITQYELSGFHSTGDVIIDGVLSAANIYSNGVPVAVVVDPIKTTIVGNGVLSSFSVSGAGVLTNPSALIVAIDGAMQEAGVDYSVLSGTITFSSPLPNGSKAVIISPTNSVQVGQVIPSDGSVTSQKLANDIQVNGQFNVVGNVGIGTSTPTVPLEVVNNVSSQIAKFTHSNSTAIFLNRTASVYNGFAFSDSNSEKWFIGQKAASDNLVLRNSGAFDTVSMEFGSPQDSLYINSTGRIGVGTSSPSAQLHTVSTTEQSRIGYDSSNYITTTVGSTGGATFSNGGTATDVWTYNGNMVLNGTNNRAPNQTAATVDSIITRDLYWMENLLNPTIGLMTNGGAEVNVGGSASSNLLRPNVSVPATSGTNIRLKMERFRTNSGGNINFANEYWVSTLIQSMFVSSNTSDACIRLRIGFSAPTSAEPAGGDAPIPANGRGVGVEFQRNPVNNIMRYRLFGRDGTNSTAGTLLSSSWVDMVSFPAATSYNKSVALMMRHIGATQTVELYFSIFNATGVALRVPSTPILTLSGVGIPNDEVTMTYQSPGFDISVANPATGGPHGGFIELYNTVAKI